MQAQTILRRFQLSGFCTLTLASTLVGSFTTPAHAACNQYLGRASNGLEISLDQCSINRLDGQIVEFTYYLGGEQLSAQADCADRSWIVFPEQIRVRPSSRATQTMLRTVCNDSGKTYYYNKPPNRKNR